ncbi:PTS sugar transporter subunit IIA [Thermoanaerobacterium sp. DL9XJH110]|uniref:PTS sugar transporter subunit IIA n=1 Tax=Thermoanaerobacterium sp. DL9XJH110 TaxID=3386643 RepID=UPI003BB7B072
MFFGIFGNNNNNNYTIIRAPMSGRIVNLAELPDEVFAQKMVGDGIAIDPSEGAVVAPFDGAVKQVVSSGHAMVLESEEGLPVLIHIGLDTVNLKGEGFEILVREGQTVKTGDLLVKFDLGVITRNFSPLSPVVLPEGEKVKGIEFTAEKQVVRGRDVLMKVLLK